MHRRARLFGTDGRREAFRSDDGYPLNKGDWNVASGEADQSRASLVFGRGAGDSPIRVGIRVGCPWSDRERQTSVGSGKGCLDTR